MMELACLQMETFLATPRVVLMDLELTCWEDSLRTYWADPRQPPELLEIGLAAYDLEKQEVVSTFSSLIRPALNPVLSAYCLNLLTITQEEIDAAPSLAEATQNVLAWESALGFANTPTCTWCTLDRAWLRDDARRVGCLDPFEGRSHVNLSSLLLQALGDVAGATPPRDSMTARLGLPSIPNRHRALPDAVDLARFCALLRSRQGA